jgi:hypothetical protein
MSDAAKSAQVMEALKAAEGEPAETALSMLNELVGLVQGEDDQGLEVAVATGLAGLAMTGRALRFLAPFDLVPLLLSP